MARRTKESLITQKLLHKYFNYDPLTGLMTNKFKRHTSKKDAPIGTTGKRGYIRFNMFGENHYMHRLIWLYVYGHWPDTIDHINFDKSDNRIENLTNVTHVFNVRKRQNKYINDAGYRGIYRVSGTYHRYGARVNINGKRHYLGTKATAKEASELYENYIKNANVITDGIL